MIAAKMSISRSKWLGRALPAACLVAAAGVLSFKAGMLFESCQASACMHVKQVKRLLIAPDAVQGVQLNAYDQLIRYPGKTEVPAPPIGGGKTLTLFVLGQSNAANAGGERFDPDATAILNFHDGHFFRASDPLLGASGIAGSPWNRLAKKLIDGGDADRVVLVSVAVGWTSVLDWAPGGRLHGMLLQRLAQARQQRLDITHFLWHQGEEDTRLDPNVYRDALIEIVRSVQAQFPHADFHIAQTSVCGQETHSEALLQAQAEAAAATHATLGPNTDQIGMADRFDDCHLSGSGLAKHADMWFATLHKKAH